MLGKFGRLLYLIGGFFIYHICWFIPKKNNKWIFGSWFGKDYSDNTKYFFEYINKNKKNIDPIWLSHSIKTVNVVRSKGYKAYKINSPKGIWHAARAKYAFTTSFVQNVLNPYYITKNTKIVNLWHGIPLKVLGRDHNRITSTGELKDSKTGLLSRIKKKLWSILFPFVERPDDYFLAPCEEAFNTLKSAFPGHENTTHFISPYPRNDVYKESRDIGLAGRKKIIYMPTWRSFLGSTIDLFSDYNFDTKNIDSFLKERNSQLDIKLHKYSKMSSDIKSKIDEVENIQIIDNEDVNDIINNYDMLITDYSSIYFDYLYSGRPIIFTPFDLEHYQEYDHKFYYNYNDVTPGPKAKNWDDVLELIDSFNKNSSLYSQEREAVHKRFSSNASGNFSELLFKKIMEFNL